MARKPSPWYREERGEWCVTIAGRHHRLGAHPPDAPAPVKSRKTGRWNAPEAIEREFRRLLDAPDGDAPHAAPHAPDGGTVVEVLDAFITWCKENRAGRTAARYGDLCQRLVSAPVGGVKVGTLPALSLTPRHITSWLDANPSWGPTTKRNAITAVMRGLNWAVKNLGLARNPIKGMEKPEARKATSVVSPEEFERLLAAVKDARFRDLLAVSYDTGCRPQEAKALEARHLQLDKKRAVLPASEAKGRKHPRTIYLPTARSLEAVTRLARLHPEGPLFRNRLGNRWTGMAVKCRMEDLEGVLGRRVTHYTLRHSRITDWLVSGVDSHVVAKLSGHQDSSMLDSTYSHVQDDYEYMLGQAARKAGDKGASPPA